MSNGTNGGERRRSVYCMDCMSQIQAHTSSAFKSYCFISQDNSHYSYNEILIGEKKIRKHTEGFKANCDNMSAPFLSLCLTFEYLASLEYSWAFMHLVILMTEHQFQMPISLAYLLLADESYFSSTD